MRYMMFVAVDSDPDKDFDGALSIDEWFDQIPPEKYVMGDRLRPASDAKLVRVRKGGETLITDGAFTESKEWIAGFDILECDSIDEAIAIAAKHPQARGGRIEVREFWPL